jgi:adenylate cyclase
VSPPPLTLRAVRRLLEGVVPPALATASAERVPHVNYLSHAEYVDDEHIALTFQFFNRSRANVMATGRAALCIEDPISGVSIVLQLRYLHTETSGPVFERLRAKLAGIAAHTGMEKVFKLQGADIYHVDELYLLDPRHPMPSIEPRVHLAAGARVLSQRLAECDNLGELMRVFCAGLKDELRIEHAIVWLLNEARSEAERGLFLLTSTGYGASGIGAEMPLADAGLAGVAVREGVPIRIGHMSSMYRYGMAWRTRAESLGLDGVIAPEIPLPGLATPRSQLAVPLRARGKTVGALLVESDRDQFFSYDDEDTLTLVGAQLAQAIALLRAAELDEDTQAARKPPSVPTSMRKLRLRHYRRDHSLFVNDEYVIKGVAGAILWKVAGIQASTGREDFTTRELRLAGDDLRLPEVQDNLGVRLLLLERRLAERDFGLRIERVSRGRYRLVVDGLLLLEPEEA